MTSNIIPQTPVANAGMTDQIRAAAERVRAVFVDTALDADLALQGTAVDLSGFDASGPLADLYRADLDRAKVDLGRAAGAYADTVPTVPRLFTVRDLTGPREVDKGGHRASKTLSVVQGRTSATDTPISRGSRHAPEPYNRALASVDSPVLFHRVLRAYVKHVLGMTWGAWCKDHRLKVAATTGRMPTHDSVRSKVPTPDEVLTMLDALRKVPATVKGRDGRKVRVFRLFSPVHLDSLKAAVEAGQVRRQHSPTETRKVARLTRPEPRQPMHSDPATVPGTLTVEAPTADDDASPHADLLAGRRFRPGTRSARLYG